MARPIKLTKAKFDDRGDGYRYSGWYYLLDLGSVVYRVRRYSDSPEEASFLSYRRPRSEEDLAFERIPSDDRDFVRAASYLRESLGVPRVRLLTLAGGYLNVGALPDKARRRS